MVDDAGSSIQLERFIEMAENTANSNSNQNVNNNNTTVNLQQLLTSMGQQQQLQLQQNNMSNMLLLSRSHPSSSSCGSTIDVNTALPQKRSADSEFLNPSTTVVAAKAASSSFNCNNGNKRLKEDDTSTGNQAWNQLHLQQQQREQLSLLMGRLGMGQQSPVPTARMMVMSNNINSIPNNLLMGVASGNNNNQGMLASTMTTATTNTAPATASTLAATAAAANANMRMLKSSKNSFPMPVTGKIFAYKRPKLSTYKSLWQRTKPELRKHMLNYQVERSNVKLSKARSDVINSNIMVNNDPTGMDMENPNDVKQIQQQQQQHQQQLLQNLFIKQTPQGFNQQSEPTISTNEPEDGDDGVDGVYHV